MKTLTIKKNVIRMNHITIKFSSLTTIKREEFKFIVNFFFENNQNYIEQNETV